MAVNLDKDAYYRRIKRLYGNWKVNEAHRGLVEPAGTDFMSEKSAAVSAELAAFLRSTSGELSL